MAAGGWRRESGGDESCTLRGGGGMADTLMRLIRVERGHVPTPMARQAAVRVLRAFLPAAECVEATVSDEVRFVDCGGNWSGVECPNCGADAEPWWADEVSRCREHN